MSAHAQEGETRQELDVGLVHLHLHVYTELTQNSTLKVKWGGPN